MARSYDHPALRALRGPQRSGDDGDDLASGPEVFWGHATSDVRLAALRDVGDRLLGLRPDTICVFTVDPEHVSPDFLHRGPGAPVLALQDDLPQTGRRFLETWSPSVCLWTGGYLRRTLLAQASRRGVGLVLLDVDEAGFQDVRRGVFGSPVAATLDLFGSIVANTGSAAATLEWLGAPRERITVSPRLRGGIAPAPCTDSDLDEMTDMLAGRQVWLAAYTSLDELDAVVQAQRHALRLAHRLLLILVPDEPGDAPAFREYLALSGLRCADWDEGDVPEDDIQVLLSSAHEDLGLWYRMAPLSFMGCSLWPGRGGRNPFEPAVLGSAVLCGPNVRRYVAAYERLSAAGAARIVKDTQSLGQAVVHLIAPDRSAAMALAAWDVATEGAQVTDQVLDLLQDMFEDREATNADT